MRCSNSHRLWDLLQSVGSTAKVGQGIQDVSIYTCTYVHAYFSKGVKVIKVKSRFFLTMTAKIFTSGAHSGPRRLFRVVNKETSIRSAPGLS